MSIISERSIENIVILPNKVYKRNMFLGDSNMKTSMSIHFLIVAVLLPNLLYGQENWSNGYSETSAVESQSFERQAPSSPLPLKLSFAPIVKKTASSVVNIYTQRVIRTRESALLSDPFFRQFFGHDLRAAIPREKVERSLGSGVIVSPDGLVVTCYHVVQDSDQIIVVLSDKREYQAKVIKIDPKSDLAILKISADKMQFPFAEIGSTESAEIGDFVLAIGNPFGLDQTVTNGIISAKKTIMGNYVLQTDAAINIGNSGGGLFDTEGRLVGVNSAIYSKSGGSNGIGFAVPAELVKVVLQSVGTQKPPQKPWLGFQGGEVTPEIANAMGIERPIGVYVSRLYPKGPADLAGLKIGDIITKVDGKDVTDAPGLDFMISTKPSGGQASMDVIRNGRFTKIRFPLLPPSETRPRDLTKLGGDHPLTGAVVANLSPALATEMSISAFDDGVVITKLEPSTRPFRFGFQEGDVITQVNQKRVQSVKELTECLNDEHIQWQISFRRGEEMLSLAVRA